MLLDTLCSKDESVRESVQTCEQAANEGRFRLRDLLAVPMQRVLKYHLILRELVTHTSKYYTLHTFLTTCEHSWSLESLIINCEKTIVKHL